MSVGSTRARLAAPVVVPLLMLAVFRAVPVSDLAFVDRTFHLIFATVITTTAVIVAFAAARAGRKSAHHGPVWLAAGCMSVGLLMLAHGLLTPGVLGRPMNQWGGRTPYLALTLFAIALTLAARPRNAITSRLAVARPTCLLGTFAALLTALSSVIVLDPTAMGGAAPVSHESVIRWMLTVGNSIAFAAAAVVHGRRWRLGYDPVQY